MKQAALKEQGVLTRALAAVQAGTGLRATTVFPNADVPLPLASERVAALVEFQMDNRYIRFPVQVKAVERFQGLGMLKAKPGTQQSLLVAPWISPALAQRCRELDIPFIDTAGNASITTKDVLIFISGNPRPPQMSPVIGFRALTPAGLRIVFVLLHNAGMIQATYRQISQAAGVALGVVGPVLADLQARGFLLPTQNGARRLIERDALIDEWVAQYPIRLRPKLQGWRMTAPKYDWWQAYSLQPQEGCWGGEVAAAKLTGYLKPATVTLYAAHKPEQLILTNRLRPDTNGEVEILQPFWTDINSLSSDSNCAPSLVVYADLINSGEARNLETAELIRERYLGS
jgi:hypothetical protein